MWHGATPAATSGVLVTAGGGVRFPDRLECVVLLIKSDTLLLRVRLCGVGGGVFCRLLQRGAGTVHEARKEPLYVLIVVARARIHDLDVLTHAFEKSGDVGVHASRLVLGLVFVACVCENLWDVVLEKRGQ